MFSFNLFYFLFSFFFMLVCFIALTNFWNARWASHHQTLRGNSLTCCNMSPIHPVNILLLLYKVCGTWDAVATRKVHREKNVNLKYVQGNVLEIVKGTKKSGGCIRTEAKAKSS